MLSLVAFCVLLYLLAGLGVIGDAIDSVRLLRALGLATGVRTAPEEPS